MTASGFTIRPAVSTMKKIHKMGTYSATPELRRAMMAATEAAVPILRSRIRALPSSQGYGAHGLRGDLARAVRRAVKTIGSNVTASIFIKGKGSAPLANLARCVEGELPWKHPTFGHDPQVSQRSHPFFYSTLKEVVPSITRAMKRAMISYEVRIR